jgi:hypothetical protein
MHIDPELAKLLADQGGVVARWQLLDPATLARVDRRLVAGSWQARYDGVYVSHNGPLTRSQERWAGVLACRAGAALSGPTVLELAGVKGFESDLVHVAVPWPRHGPPLPGLSTTRVCKLENFIHPARTLPQVRLAYAVLSVAAGARRDDDAHAVLTSAVQQGRVSVRQLRNQLATLPKLPRRALIRESLLDIADGAQSLNEIALLQLVKSGGLPHPVLQIHVATARRRSYIDGGWPGFEVWFEVDGELHRDTDKWADDLDRGNELAIEQGGTRLRWPGFVVRRRPERVVDQATRALVKCGWPGP